MGLEVLEPIIATNAAAAGAGTVLVSNRAERASKRKGLKHLMSNSCSISSASVVDKGLLEVELGYSKAGKSGHADGALVGNAGN